MFSTILSWLTGPIIGAISKPLVEAYKARLDATNEEQKLAADGVLAEIAAQREARKQATQIRLETAGFWEMRLLTFCIAAPFTLHAGAVGLDTTFGFGWGISAYPKPFDEWEGAILLSFFGLYAATGAVRTVASAIRGRR